VEAARVARQAGARVVALTCRADSDLAELADHLILLPFTPISRKTPHTLDYLVTVQALVILALAWAGRDPMTLKHILDRLPAWIAAARRESHEKLAHIGLAQRFVFLGGGPDLATAAYAAAKLHEAGGLQAIAAETENFVHGMNFMLEPGDALIAVATGGAGVSRGREILAAYQTFGVQTWLLTGMADKRSGPLHEFARSSAPQPKCSSSAWNSPTYAAWTWSGPAQDDLTEKNTWICKRSLWPPNRQHGLP
jgi:fructoselysine-6-P-deglycase FrlB-like protein